MGCCQSAETIERRQRSNAIDNELKRERAGQKSEVKLLLLGAGESGKSTILKQMKLIHDDGYSLDEREAFKEIIFSNTVQSMRVILEAMDDMGVPLSSPEQQQYATVIMELPAQIERDTLPPEVTQAVKALWNDPNLQSVFERSREYQLNDSAR